MEKKSVFSKVILFLCFIALIVNVVETNQIRLQTQSANAETLIQKVLHNFPKEVKLNQKFISEKIAEIIIKDKNIVEQISAPNVKVLYNYWGEPYSENHSYLAKDENNRLIYLNTNVKSLYNKYASLNELIKAKIIYDDKYEFDCFPIVTTKDKTDFTSIVSFMPLQSQDVYFVAEMPKNFVNSKEAINFEFLIGNNKYILKLR